MKMLFGILVAVLLPMFCAIDIYQAGNTVGLAIGVGTTMFFSSIALGSIYSLREDLKTFSNLMKDLYTRR